MRRLHAQGSGSRRRLALVWCSVLATLASSSETPSPAPTPTATLSPGASPSVSPTGSDASTPSGSDTPSLSPTPLSISSSPTLSPTGAPSSSSTPSTSPTVSPSPIAPPGPSQSPATSPSPVPAPAALGASHSPTATPRAGTAYFTPASAAALSGAVIAVCVLVPLLYACTGIAMCVEGRPRSCARAALRSTARAPRDPYFRRGLQHGTLGESAELLRDFVALRHLFVAVFALCAAACAAPATRARHASGGGGAHGSSTQWVSSPLAYKEEGAVGEGWAAAAAAAPQESAAPAVSWPPPAGSSARGTVYLPSKPEGSRRGVAAAAAAASPAPAVAPGAAAALSVGIALLELAEVVAPAIPFVAPILSLLSAVLKTLERMGLASTEARRLQQRLLRLGALVREVASDGAFVERHGASFAALLAALRGADECLTRLAAQSSVRALVSSVTNTEQLAVLDRDLSERLAELTTAQGAETLSAVRVTTELTAATLSAVRGLQQLAPPPSPPPPRPRPPFSMSLTLSSFAFDPPLATQLATAPRGSFGVVVFATWLRERLAVAIKLLPVRGATGEALSPGAWLEEAEHMRRLSEAGGGAAAHVVHLYGIGADGAYYLVVMERLEGSMRCALDGYLAAGRHPALATALGWVADVARGCAECHAVRVVHADIKSANTLLTAARTAKLGDLGSARVTRGLAATHTRGAPAAAGTMSASTARGSFLWTAPELLDDPTAAPSCASDVWAWAVVAWEVLSRHVPYHDADSAPCINLERLGVRVDIVSGALRPDLARVRTDAPPALVALMQRAWASDPRSRPTIGAVVLELDRIALALQCSA